MNVKSLTLDEKLTLLTGDGNWRLERLGGKIPEIYLSDGPHGLRTMKGENETTLKATAFPTLSALASTWNKALAREMGELIAEEAIEREVDVVLAPGVNIKRTPYNGRNFEYFSEDPHLAGELAAEYVSGIQSKGIGTSVKHFAANSSEYDRFYQSSEIDERTLNEIYLPAFERVLKEKPWTVMCAYNLLNGVYCSEHKQLLKDILRDRFGFDGVIVSDWGAVIDRAKSLKATLDLEMPHSDNSFGVLKAAYERGYITEEEIDASVTRLLELAEKVQSNKPLRKIEHTQEERHAATVRIAQEAAVLLKNDGALPLKNGEKVVVGGKKAKTGVFGGGGSACIDSAFVPEDLATLLRKENPAVEVRYHEAYFSDWGNHHGYFNLRGLITKAEGSDKAIVVVGNDANTDCEGDDRMTLRLSPIEEDLIHKIAAANKQTIVVVYGGSAIDMSSWIGEVNAVLYVNFNGEGGNEAIAKLLTGTANPSGKLAESFPFEKGRKYADGWVDEYRERMFVGYRGYDKSGEEILFPFGFGLSYATFGYSDLSIEKKGTMYEVSLSVSNLSEYDGKEIVQLYVGEKHALVARPVKELKGFEKVELKAGETKRVTFTLCPRDFAHWSTPLGGWHVDSGIYTVSVGGSSGDLPLKQEINMELPYDEQPSTRNEK